MSMIVPDVEGIRDYKLRLDHLAHNYKDFMELKTKEWANKIVVDEIVKRMQDANFSSKIWQNTYLKEVTFTNKKIKIRINSEYTTVSGFDVAVAREKGTKRHFIQPNTRQALSWITQGVRLFSKGHWVSGIKSLRIIHKTIEQKKPELQDKLNLEFEKWMVRVFTE